MFNRLSKLFIAGLMAWPVVSSQPSFADAREDFYIRQAMRRYFNLPQNARTFGMAGSSVATSRDSSSVIGNPAGLGFMKDAEVSATYGREYNSGREEPSYRRIDEDIDSGHALFAVPVGPNLDDLPDFGNLGLGWSGYRSDVDDTPGTETKGYRIHAAYAKALGESTSVGYGFSYLNDQLDNDFTRYGQDDGYRHTLGVQQKVSDALTLGASFFYGYGEPVATVNFAPFPTQRFSGDRDSFGGEIGAAYDLGSTLLAFSVDYQEYDVDGDGDTINENGRSFAGRVGIEQEFLDWLVGRAGYRYQGNEYYAGGIDAFSGTAKYNAVAFGAGINLKDYLRLDYGAEYRWIAYNDWVHTVTLSVPFSICEQDIFGTGQKGGGA